MRHTARPIHKTNVMQKNANKLMKDLVIIKLYPNTGRITAVKLANVYHTVSHVHSYLSANCDINYVC
jgi:hypothetical protein